MNEVKRQEILSKTDEILYELNAIVLDDYDKKEHRENAEELIYVIQGLLDLYQKEKEKNKELRKPKYIMDFKTNKITKLTNDFVSKDKIKELIDKRGNNGYTSLDCIEDIKELLEERN